MKSPSFMRKTLLPALLGIFLVAGSAHAQVRINITIAPPAPLYEAIPTVAPGYIWAPGYWAWHGDQHIWVRGRTIVQRPGYYWQPDRWEQRDAVYYRYPGTWALDPQRSAPPPKKEKKEKKERKEKKSKHDNRDNGNR